MTYEHMTFGPGDGRFDHLSSKQLFRKALDAKPGSRRYWKRVAALHRRGGRKLFRAAATCLKSRKATRRRVGADILTQLGTNAKGARPYAEESLRLVVPMLDSETNARVVGALLNAVGYLGGLGDDFSVGHDGTSRLLELSRSPDAAIRGDAAFALSALTSPVEVEPECQRCIIGLTEMTGDPDTEVRDWVSFYLAGIVATWDAPNPPVIAALSSMVDDAHPTIRAQAIKGLAEAGERSVIPNLLVALDDDPKGRDLHSCGELLAAAAELKAPALLPALVAFRDRAAAGRNAEFWLPKIDHAIVECVRGIESALEAVTPPKAARKRASRARPPAPATE